MTDTDLIPIVEHLRAESTLQESHLKTIRDLYRQILHISDDPDMPDDPDENAMSEVARQLKLRVDTYASREYLRECVRYEDISDAKLVVSGKLAVEVQPLNECTVSPIASPPIPRIPSLNIADDVIVLADIDCWLNIKNRTPELDHFIHSFLLHEIKESHPLPIHVTDPARTLRDDEQSPLNDNCLLYHFVRQQVRARGIVTSLGNRNLTRFRLIEPVSLTDEFGTWHYDHLCDLFDLEMTPHGTNAQFPARWRLADSARIHCRMNYHDSTARTSSISSGDKPRTTSLEVFVRDVCTLENNDQSDKWLHALADEDILTFKHLANLRESEWNNIRRLPMNAIKILQSAVNRYRENVTDERHQRLSNNFDEEDDNETMYDTTKQSSYSRSKLLADLHLIKLFISYTLRDERPWQHRGALPKLEADCLHTAFAEMREEGFADDGLFLRIREFFVPFTISEQELRMERGLDTQKRQNLLKDHQQLLNDIDRRMTETNAQTDIFWRYDEQIALLQKRLNDAKADYSHLRLTMVASVNSRHEAQYQQAESLQQLDQGWRKLQATLMEQIQDTRNLKIDIGRVITELDQQLDEDKTRLKNIDEELSKPRKRVNKQLVKPARGLIMYGPPGTGKSEIMSKLASKLGIAMVGPPLAAGELNRPLVGQSEQVIISLLTRCYRIPYAMCCVSIDEIDSLAPKRDEGSSEHKADKISVLLSLIDGVKDVPNLLILCATNRLHMMDEAFLRRMSGKFFVGRPSSDARNTILKTIPDWALQSEILDRLSSATTNFSGAALKALTRAITVKCIETRRSRSNYEVDYEEALIIADRIAQNYQIFFGSETLPRLLLRNLPILLANSRLRIHQLPNKFNYTGRIIIDLYTGHVRIEVRQQRGNIENGSLSITEDILHPSEINVQGLLERLAGYGKSRNVQLLQLVDLNLLASQNAYDEKRVFETLKDRYDECVAYTRSMIVYDLDGLVGVNKSQSDSSLGRSTSSSIVNQNIYTYVRARFRDCAIEDQQQQETGTIERWAVAVIREPFLLRQFCTDVEFTRTHREEEELELERRKAVDLLKCVKCKDFYIENENKIGSCVHHDGFVYDNSAADLIIYTPSQATMVLNKLECDGMNNPEVRNEFECQKSKFKWICCDAVLFSGNVGGCKRGTHGFNVVDGDQQHHRQFAGSRTDRLDQATIQQWEEACRVNEDYNEKWLSLLNARR